MYSTACAHQDPRRNSQTYDEVHKIDASECNDACNQHAAAIIGQAARGHYQVQGSLSPCTDGRCKVLVQCSHTSQVS